MDPAAWVQSAAEHQPNAGMSTVGFSSGNAAPAVQPTSSAVSTAGSGTETCEGQTWPYLEDDCLAGGSAKKDVRVLRPEQPSQSAQPIVIAAPTGKETAKALAEAAVAKSAVEAKEAIRKEKHRRHTKRARPVVEPEAYEAYARPYRGRYERYEHYDRRRGDWGGGWGW
jgi:hypothetical protein